MTPSPARRPAKHVPSAARHAQSTSTTMRTSTSAARAHHHEHSTRAHLTHNTHTARSHTGEHKNRAHTLHTHVAGTRQKKNYPHSITHKHTQPERAQKNITCTHTPLAGEHTLLLDLAPTCIHEGDPHSAHRSQLQQKMPTRGGYPDALYIMRILVL